MHADCGALQLLHAEGLRCLRISGKSLKCLLIDVVADKVFHLALNPRLHDRFKLRLHLKIVTQDFGELGIECLQRENLDTSLRLDRPVLLRLLGFALETI